MANVFRFALVPPDPLGSAMRKASLILALLAVCLPTACEAACVADQHGGMICGEGKDAARIIDDTTSPDKKLAIAWRCAAGMPADEKEPAGDVEDVIIRLEDGAVLGKLGGQYWNTGTMRPNRDEFYASWSPDSRAVVEVSTGRWETTAFAYYAIDGSKATKVDLLSQVASAAKAKIPASLRQIRVFRVMAEEGLKVDNRGRLGFTVLLFEPKQEETERAFAASVTIKTKNGQPAARVEQVRSVKLDSPR
jgi:hypothetical protein